MERATKLKFSFHSHHSMHTHPHANAHTFRVLVMLLAVCVGCVLVLRDEIRIEAVGYGFRGSRTDVCLRTMDTAVLVHEVREVLHKPAKII